jgi:DNA-binding SARP family transcriptional activator
MLELQTFGTVGLRTRDVGDSVATPVQAKRLALLAFLAVAPRRRLRRRDQIVALFWPGLDAEHARSALSQALRYLRRCLGDRVVLTQGEEEVGVDGQALWCDAAAFAAASDAGDLEAALALYKGSFLEGLFVTGAAPEYEEWVALERTRFRILATAAAAGLAEAAARDGNLAGAVPWARRAAALSPEDEGAAARLIGYLARSGDRAGAIGAYEALQRRLKTEYGVRPAPETQRLMAEILAR